MRNAIEPSDSKRVLIIDALNMFLRSYTIIPSMNPKGMPNGGTVGFIRNPYRSYAVIFVHKRFCCMGWPRRIGEEKTKEKSLQTGAPSCAFQTENDRPIRRRYL